MGDVNQVVGLDPFLNPGFPEGRPVDGVQRPDLHIIVDADDAGVGNLMVSFAVRSEPEPVASDHGARMDDHPVPDSAIFPNGRIGVYLHIAADGHPIPDHHPGMQPDPVSHGYPVADDHPVEYRNRLTCGKMLADTGVGADEALRNRVRVKQFHYPGEGHLGVFHPNQRLFTGFALQGHDHGPGVGVTDPFQKLRGSGQGDLIRPGGFKGRNPVDHHGRISVQPPVHRIGDLF